jgi:hypothetical protein
MEAVCGVLKKNMPSACRSFFKEEGVTYFEGRHDELSAQVILTIVILLVSINLGLLYAYRQCTKKEMQDTLSMQVSAAVSNYIAVNERDFNN